MTAPPVVEHSLTHSALGDVRVRVHQRDHETAVVLLHGSPRPDARVLVRIQSACAYGEIFNSLNCDCRDQLDETYHIIGKRRAGVLIYLNQEGRGSGLLIKAKAYHRQQTYGQDTVDAYESLGVHADVRTYDLAAEALHDLGLRRITLLTNNPRKISSMREAGLDVKREPLVLITPKNVAYLNVKRTKLGHLIEIPVELLPTSTASARTL